MNYLIFLLLVFLTLSDFTIAQEVIILNDKELKYLIGRYTYYFEDKSSQYNFENISSELFQNNFKKNDNKVLHLSPSNSTIWVRFSAGYLLHGNSTWLLELDYPLLQDAELYYPDSNNKYNLIKNRTGNEIRRRMAIFKLPFKNKDTTLFYLRIKNKTTTVLPLTIWNGKEFSEEIIRNNFLLGGFYGITFIMLFFYLSLFISLKDSNFLFYTLYFGCYGFYQFTFDGLGQQQIWINNPTWNLAATIFFPAFYIIFGTYFTRSFLQTKVFSGTIDRIIKLSLYPALLILLLYFFVPYNTLNQFLTYYLKVFTLLQLYAGIFILKKGFKPAKFFIFASSLLAAVLFLREISELWINSIEYPGIFGIHIVSLFCMIILGFASSNRIRVLREDKKKEMLKFRKEIASDLHDEVGSNLGSISLISQRLEKCYKQMTPENWQEEIMEISRTALSTNERLREILWFINPKNDDSESLLFNIKVATGSLLKDIEYTFIVDEAIIPEIRDVYLKRNLYLMYKEILYNIAKHSHAKNVEIKIGSNNGLLIMSVKDDGKGFDPNVHFAGMGMDILKSRARAINAAELKINSTPGNGTEIIITVKITQMRDVNLLQSKLTYLWKHKGKINGKSYV